MGTGSVEPKQQIRLIEREIELDQLRNVIDRIPTGSSEWAIIEGTPGIGKTRLLEETLLYGRHAGLRVLRGEADEVEQSRPFHPLLEALGQLDSAAAELHEIRGMLGYADHRQDMLLGGIPDFSHQIIDVLADVLERACMRGPTVLVLEDVQWADEATLRAVRSLARRLERFPFGIFLTVRPVPARHEVAVALANLIDLGATRVVLQPLNIGAVIELARETIGSEIGPNLRTQLEMTGGTPLFVLETIHALRDEGSIEVIKGQAEVGDLTLPPSLRLTILRRISFVSDEVLEILKIASILGRRFSLADLSALTTRPGVALLSVIEAALKAGVLVEVEDLLYFRHELIRKAVYEELPTSVRRELHREASRALIAGGAGASAIAEQVSLGASRGDKEAVAILRRAAVDTAPAGPATAVQFLERALELCDDISESAAIARELRIPLIRVGRLSDADRLISSGLERATDVLDRIELQRLRAVIMFYQGDRPAATALVASNAELPDAPRYENATDLALAAVGAMYGGDLDQAQRMAEQAFLIGETTENPFAVSNSLATRGAVARFKGAAKDAMELGAKAVEIAARASGVWADFFPRPELLVGAAALDADLLDQANTYLRAGLADRRSVQWDAAWYQMYLAGSAFLAGRWDDAVAEASAGMSIVDDMEFTPFAAAVFPYGLRAAIAVHRGDFAAADTAIGRAEQELATSGPQPGIDLVLWAKALLAEARGETNEAISQLDSIWSLYGMFGYHFAHRFVALDLVRLLVDARDRGAAEAVVSELEHLASRAGVATARGAALRCRYLLDGGLELLLRSVGEYRSGPRVFEFAQACEDAAIALADATRMDEARGMLEEAVDIYESVGAIRASDRAEARARSAGLRRGRRGRRRRPALGWDSLTPTERRVLEFLGQGLTNRGIGERMFISPRTVETHVAHLFAKLQVSSRTQLAALAGRDELAASEGDRQHTK